MACLPLALVTTRRSDCDILGSRMAVTCLPVVLSATGKRTDEVGHILATSVVSNYIDIHGGASRHVIFSWSIHASTKRIIRSGVKLNRAHPDIHIRFPVREWRSIWSAVRFAFRWTPSKLIC